MSISTRKPLRMAGATINSGFPNTGEVPVTQGGMYTAQTFSGNLLAHNGSGFSPGYIGSSGGHIQLWSGAGRLHKIIPHSILTSGQPVTFYDAGTITVSGISVSGTRIIGRIPARSRATLALASGEVDTAVSWQDVISVDMPFTSGLCAAAASGAPGFSVSFTPETIRTGSDEN